MAKILDELKLSGIKSVAYLAKEPMVTKPSKNPRDKLLAYIDNGIDFFHDPTLTAKDKKGNKKPLPICYSMTGDVADIVLKYYRKTISIDEKPGITVSKDELLVTLEKLKEYTARGAFDKQLDAIKNVRTQGRKKKK